MILRKRAKSLLHLDHLLAAFSKGYKWCFFLLLSRQNSICDRSSMVFWTPGLPEGVLSNCPCPWSVRWSVSPSVRLFLNISETTVRIVLIFCMKLGHHKGTKVTEPDFWKKDRGGRKVGKTPIFGSFLMFLSTCQKRF